MGKGGTVVVQWADGVTSRKSYEAFAKVGRRLAD